MLPAEKIALIRRLATDIHQSLSVSPADALNAPTACTGWDVGTIVAHLTGGAMRQHDSMIRGREGHGGPPVGVAGVTTPDEVQQRNAISNRQLRDEFGEGLLDRFRDAYDTLHALLSSWSDWTVGCWHHRRGTMSADSYLDLRIQELVIHDWDMRSGGTDQATMDAAGVVALLPVSAMWYDLCFRSTARLPKPFVYRFEVGEEADGTSWRQAIIVTGDSFRIIPASGASQADITLTCSAETYLLCLYGRLSWEAAIQQGRMAVSLSSEHTISGEMMARFGAWFGGL